MSFIKFKYKVTGININNEKITLFRYASSKSEVLYEIKYLNLSNIKVKLSVNSFNDIKFKGGEKLNTNELLEFLNNLYDLIKLGTSLHESLKFLKKIASNNKMKDLYSQLYNSVVSGFTLSRSLESTGMIPNYVILVIKTAEKTGDIDNSIAELIKYYSEKNEIFGKIKSAMINPAITMIMLFGASLFLILNVIPKIYGLFKANPRIKPPSTTQNLYDLGVFIKDNTTISIIILFGIIFGIIALLKNPKTAKFVYYIPILKNLKKYEFQTEFLMTLYLLIKSGTNINSALHILYENEENAFIRKIYKNIENLYSKGISFSKIVVKYPYLFDELVGFMFEKGEKTGTLNEVTAKLYETYKRKVKAFLEKFPETIKISTLIVGGGILLYVFMGILQPVIVFTTQMGN